MPVGVFGGSDQSVNRLYNEPGGPIAAGLAEGIGLLPGGALLTGDGPLTAAAQRIVQTAGAQARQEQQARAQQFPALVSPVNESDP